jgi:DDE superfamily endonuclease
MLQLETLPASLAGLVWAFRPCFTAPTFRTFAALVAGMVAQPGRHTVCGMLVGAGLSRVWRHWRAHRFFSQARWCAQRVGLVAAGLVVQHLVPAGAAVLVAVDDTLFRRSGRRVAEAFWQHDGSRPGPAPAQVGYGNNWLIAGIVVTLPFLDRPVCLPVAFTLVGKDGPGKQVLAGQLIGAIVAALPGRRLDVVADAWYAGADGAAGAARGATRGRGFPPGVSLTSRLRANATLTAIATPTRGRGGRGGRPKRIGAPLGKPKDLATTAAWHPAQVSRYGRTDQVDLADIRCLWYGVYRSRTVRVILLRDPGRPAKAGYQLALITTDLHSPAADIVTRYAARWSIEVAIEDAKQITGAGQARNRTRTAVQRTVPFALIVQSLVVLWYTRHGHQPDTITERRDQTPWYRSKTQPSYLDMITKLRRILIAARFRGGRATDPTPEETLAVHQAWAEAAA